MSARAWWGMETHFLCVRAEMRELYRACEWLGLSVYSAISGGALRFRILPIMAVIKINRQLIDRPCFQFPPIISGGAMSHSWEGSFRQFAHSGPHGSNENTRTNCQENEIITGGIIVLFSFCCDFFFFFFAFFILTHFIIQVNEAQRGVLIGTVLAVHALSTHKNHINSA